LFTPAVLHSEPAAPNPEKDKRKNAAVPHALIAGTVFRPPGFALPGARIAIKPDAEEAGGARLKAQTAVGDARGEFAVRVLPVPMRWTVAVQMNGYESQQKTVSIEGEHRADVSFVLEPVQAKPQGDSK
jgi:hypothetical protein